jgi:hypothetical protein
VVIQPLAIQLGIATPEKVYNLLFDALRSVGLDSERYVAPPIPDSHLPRIFAEEAISSIIMETEPYGVPAEPGGYNEHFGKLREFVEDSEGRFGVLTPRGIELFRVYMQNVAEAAEQERRQAELAQAAAQGPGGPPGRPGPPGSGPANLEQPRVQDGEILDESLPGAGGGANTG